jgi:hypothetical protein
MGSLASELSDGAVPRPDGLPGAEQLLHGSPALPGGGGGGGGGGGAPGSTPVEGDRLRALAQLKAQLQTRVGLAAPGMAGAQPAAPR